MANISLYKIILLVNFVFAFSLSGSAAYMLHLDSLPVDQRLRCGKLSDGLSYYIKHNDVPTGKVLIQLTVKVGYFHEDKDQRHVAHVLEHLAFQKSKNFDNIGQFLRAQGILPGVDYNATTGFTDTNYWISIPANDTALFRQCLRIVKDWCEGLVLDSATIEIERGNVANEIGGRSSPEPSSESQILEDINLLKDAKFSLRSIDGFTAKSLGRFYDDWYRPRLQAVSIVGDISEVVALKTFDHVFGSRVARPLDRRWEKYEPQISEVRRFIVEPSSSQDRVVVRQYHRSPRRRLFTVDDFRHSLLVTLYNNIMAERCAQMENSESQLGTIFRSQYEVGIINSEAGVDAFVSEIVINNVSSQAAVKRAVSLVLIEEERIKRYGFSEAELVTAIRLFKGTALASSVISSGVLADFYRNNFMYGSATLSSSQTDSLYRKILSEITSQHITEFAQKGISSPPDMVIASSEKDKRFLPDSLEVSRLRARIANSKVNPVERSNAVAARPLVSKSEEDRSEFVNRKYSEQFVQGLNITEITLENGVKIIFKPVDSSEGSKRVLRLICSKPFGASLYTGKDYWAARYCSRLIYECGVGEYKREELDRYMRSINASIYPFVLNDKVGVNAEFELAALEDVVSVAYQYLKSPRYDKRAFEKARSVLNVGPVSVYDSLLFGFVGADGPLSGHPHGAEGLSIDRVYQIYKELFWDKGNLMLVLTGSFNPSEVKPLFIKYFSDYKAESERQDSRTYKSEVEEVRACEVVHERSERNASIDIYIMGFHEFEGGDLLDLSITSKVIGEVLTRRLRDEMGSTYSVAVNAMQVKANVYQIGISFATVNQTPEAVLAATWDEISKLLEGDLDESFVSGIVGQQLSELTKNWNDQEFWQQYIYLCGLNVTEYDGLLKWKQNVTRMSGPDLRAVIRKFLKTPVIYRKNLRQA